MADETSAPYLPLGPGLELWHVYSATHAPTSFNPFADGRFSGRAFPVPRAMFYAGDTADAALWETVLRDVAPPPGTKSVFVPQAAWRGRRIAQVRTLRALQLLNLSAPQVKEVAAGNAEFRNELQLATLRADYPPTHAVAARLALLHPQADGLCWPSRQASFEMAAVLYQPPAADDWLEATSSIDLGSVVGQALIDEALFNAGWIRVDDAGLDDEMAAPPDAD